MFFLFYRKYTMEKCLLHRFFAALGTNLSDER